MIRVPTIFKKYESVTQNIMKSLTMFYIVHFYLSIASYYKWMMLLDSLEYHLTALSILEEVSKKK